MYVNRAVCSIPWWFFFSFGLYQYLLSCSVIWPSLHSLSFFLFNLSLSLSLHLARSLYILIIFAKIQILASFIFSIVFCFQFHWFLFHIAFFAPIAAIKGLLGDWGVREQRKEKFNDEFLYSESLQCLFSLLEPASPGALQVFSLEPTSVFRLCWVQDGRILEGKKKMINSPPVQRYSKFWSSSPNYFLLFMFQSPHPLCLVFIVSASQYNQVEYVFSIWSRTEKCPPHSLNQVRKGLGTDTLSHLTIFYHHHCSMAMSLSSTTTLLPSLHLQEFHRDRLQLELRQLWCLAHRGLYRAQTNKKHFFLQRSIPII